MCEQHPLWCSADDPSSERISPPASTGDDEAELPPAARRRAEAWEEALQTVERQGWSVREWLAFDRWMRAGEANRGDGLDGFDAAPPTGHAGDPYGAFGDVTWRPVEQASAEHRPPPEAEIPPEYWRTITA